MHRALLAKHRGKLRQVLERRVSARMLVGGDGSLLPLPSRDLYRGDLIGEAPLARGAGGAALALERVLVLLLTADMVEIRQLLGGLSHEHAADRVQESVAVHPVDDGGISEPVSGPRAIEEIGNAAHALGSTREHEARLARADMLGREDDRLEPRTARLIHRERGALLRYPRADQHLARDVRSPSRLARAAVDQLVDIPARHARARERGRGCRDPEIGGAQVGERSQIASDGGADGGNDRDAFHGDGGRSARAPRRR